MYQSIEEYIRKPLEERKAHLRFEEECTKIGGYDSREYRGLLAHYLNTTIPTGNRAIVLCHACNQHGCSNVRHLYWGTRSDNQNDLVKTGAVATLFARTAAKYSQEELKRMRSEAGRKGGQAKRKRKHGKT